MDFEAFFKEKRMLFQGFYVLVVEKKMVREECVCVYVCTLP